MAQRVGLHGAGVIALSEQAGAPAAAAVGVTTYTVGFDGDSSYIDCGSDASLDDLHAGAFTVDLWCKVESIGAGNYATLVFKGENTVWEGWKLEIQDSTEGFQLLFRAHFADQSAAADTDPDTALFTFGTWHHIAACYNQAVDQNGYIAVDGTWCVYSSQTAAIGALVSDAAESLLMGAGHTGGVKEIFLLGDIAWVRISSGIRYPIGVDFAAPNRCTAPDVDGTTVELWAMDEGSGVSTAAAVNSPANDGTMTDCTWAECT